MRLLISEAEPADVQTALNLLDAPGASVLLNPKWITPDPSEKLWIACGKPAVTMIQAAGWIPKKGGVEALRGKIFHNVQPDGWSSPISVGVSYAPQIYHIEPADFVTFQCDIGIYRRFEQTGTMEPILGHYTYADDLSGVIRYLKAKYAATGQPVELALDSETEGLYPQIDSKRIVCIQASAKEGIADVVYVLDDHIDYQMVERDGLQRGIWHMTPRLERIIGQLQWIADQPWIKVVGANFKFDLGWFREKWGIVFKNFAFDTCNGGSLVDENRSNTLNLHTKIYSPELGGYDDTFNATIDKSKMGEVPKPLLLPYAGGDTDACLRNYRKIRLELLADHQTPSGKPAKNSLTSVYLNVVHPTLKAVHRMEHHGVCVDVERFHEFGADLQARIEETKAHAASVLPKKLIEKYGGLSDTGGAPLSKPNMIAEFLFSASGLNLKPLQVTATTQKPSTSKYHLSQFKDHPDAGPLIERYLDYMSVAKMYGTYYEGFMKHLRDDQRWHASYIIHKQGHDKNNEQDAGGTVTGRGSATNPAFQCVTGDTEIMTPGGIKTAAELIDPLISDDAYNPFKTATIDVFTSKGWNKTSRVFKSWRTDLLRVRFENGNELKCTPEHPVLTKYHGWVAARDLTTEHQLPTPKKVDRREPTFWLVPEVARLIGVIVAVGTIASTLPYIYIELPEEHGVWAEKVMAEHLSLKISRETVDDKAVLRYNIGDRNPGTAGVEFFLALPGGQGEPLSREIRGTTAFYDFMTGLFEAGARIQSDFNHTTVVKMTDKRMAMSILRECAVDGLNPPRITQRTKGYEIKWSGHNSHYWRERAGLIESAEQVPCNRNRMFGLFVKDTVPAGEGWVYDFTVPETSDFMANGMIVHNTVPKHSYWGKRLRGCIVAPKGYVIVARDYSQGELKIAACWSGEQQMIKAYKQGIDLHTLTAATVNAMSYEEAMFLKKNNSDAYDVLRQKGKAGNFGLLYGMSAYGFMMYADQVYGVKITLEEAEAMRDAYFELYPGLLPWHSKQIMEAQQYGYVRSPLGRLRHLSTIHSPLKKVRETAHNQAINSPIQGTLVDLMWWSMGIIEEQKPELLIPFAQIHDQGLWYAPEDRAEEAIKYSGEVMENLPLEKHFGWTPELQFTSDAELGYDLANLKKVAA